MTTKVFYLSRRLVFQTSLENQETSSVKCSEICFLLFSRQSVIFKASLENQKAHLENQEAYSVNFSGKFVFGFQDNLLVSRLVLKTKRPIL